MATSASSTLTGLSDTQRDQILTAVAETLALTSGRGSRQYVNETILTKHDRFGSSPVQINSEMVGLTFFTKPRLNMSTSSLRQDRSLAMLDTLDPLSLMFSLRCNLDTVFMKQPQFASLVEASPWINPYTPFNVPLGNMLVGTTGWPDFNVEYETTQSGDFSEDMTMVRGSDRGRRTYDIQCTFRDIQGGYAMAYFYYWLHAMALQMEGITVAYSDDRAANRLNYTCSIYRFIMDPSMRTILKWAKATGCYPVSMPIGDVFNYGPGDSQVHTSQQFTIPFVANNVTYMDPIHLSAFNTLVERYAWGKKKPSKSLKNVPADPDKNFIGVPYIELYEGTNELKWLAPSNEIKDPTADLLKQIEAAAKALPADYATSRYITPTSTTETASA